MKCTKQVGLFLILVTAVLSVVTFFDFTEKHKTYPSSNITLLIAGGVDSMEYRIGKQLSVLMTKYMGQNVVVKAYPNKNGNEARDIAVSNSDDGYTILLSKAPVYIDDEENLHYKTQLKPITILTQEEIIIAISPNSRYRYISDIQRGGKLNLYTTPDDDKGELYKAMLAYGGIDTNIVELSELSKISPIDVSKGVVVGSRWDIEKYFMGKLDIIGSIFQKELYIKSSRGIGIQGFGGGEEISLQPIVVFVKDGTPKRIEEDIRESLEMATRDEIWRRFLEENSLIDMQSYTYNREIEYLKEVENMAVQILTYK